MALHFEFANLTYYLSGVMYDEVPRKLHLLQGWASDKKQQHWGGVGFANEK